MSMTISGYSQYVNSPGAYGESVAKQVQALQQQSPEQLMVSDIRISPLAQTDVLLPNVIGYAASDLAFFDSKKDNALDREELARAFANNTDLADNYLKAYDVADASGRKDGYIDIAEQTAAVLFQLNPTGLIADTIEQVANNPQLIAETGADAAKMKETAAMFRQLYNTTPRTEEEATTITAQKRQLAEMYQQTFPTLVNQTVSAIIDQTGLRSGNGY